LFASTDTNDDQVKEDIYQYLNNKEEVQISNNVLLDVSLQSIPILSNKTNLILVLYKEQLSSIHKYFKLANVEGIILIFTEPINKSDKIILRSLKYNYPSIK